MSGCRSRTCWPWALRERTTHYGIVVNLPIDHRAETVNDAAVATFAVVPAHLKKTLTWDQGTEMARHRELTARTGITIYFAERSSPWQRGANENFNGLVRQFFPKGTDLSVHTVERVAAVTRELHARPRKTFGLPDACGQVPWRYFGGIAPATAAVARPSPKRAGGLSGHVSCADALAGP